MEIQWETVLVAAIAALPAAIAALAALVKATQTHDLVNHRMDELLAKTTSSATAEATLAEKDAERSRKDLKAAGASPRKSDL